MEQFWIKMVKKEVSHSVECGEEGIDLGGRSDDFRSKIYANWTGNRKEVWMGADGMPVDCTRGYQSVYWSDKAWGWTGHPGLISGNPVLGKSARNELGRCSILWHPRVLTLTKFGWNVGQLSCLFEGQATTIITLPAECDSWILLWDCLWKENLGSRQWFEEKAICSWG